MADWPEGVTNIDAATDVVESPDEGGFYLHRYKPTDATSAIYSSEAEAVSAYRSGKVRWSK